MLSLLGLHGLAPGNALERFAPLGLRIAAAGLASETLLAAWSTPRLADVIRRRLAPLLLLVVFLVQLLALDGPGRGRLLGRIDVGELAHAYLVVFQVYVLGSLLTAFARVNSSLSQLRVRPGRLVLGLFVLLILLGTFVLRLPRMAAPGVDVGWLDALFTATSAVCVTGLTVLPTGEAFSANGQVAIALLIQLGGLGIMAVTGFLAIAFGSGLGLRERAFLADVLNTEMASQVGGICGPSSSSRSRWNSPDSPSCFRDS